MPNKVDKAEKSSKSSSKKEEVSATDNAADTLRGEGIVCTFALNSKKLHRNVRDVSVSNLTITFHGVPLVEEAELTLNYGNRYGFKNYLYYIYVEKKKKYVLPEIKI